MKILFLLMLIMSFQMFAQDTGNPRAEVVEEDEEFEVEARKFNGSPEYFAILAQYKDLRKSWYSKKFVGGPKLYRIQMVTLKIQLLKLMGKPTERLEARLKMYLTGTRR